LHEQAYDRGSKYHDVKIVRVTEDQMPTLYRTRICIDTSYWWQSEAAVDRLVDGAWVEIGFLLPVFAEETEGRGRTGAYQAIEHAEEELARIAACLR
jgi:hypothetical protein